MSVTTKEIILVSDPPPDMCRCCHSEGKFTNLEDTSIEMAGKAFGKILEETFDISLKPSIQDLQINTYTICQPCTTMLKEGRRFKLQVLECEQKFQEMYNKCPISVSSDHTKKKYDINETSNPDSTENDSNYNYHDALHDEELNPPFLMKVMTKRGCMKTADKSKGKKKPNRNKECNKNEKNNSLSKNILESTSLHQTEVFEADDEDLDLKSEDLFNNDEDAEKLDMTCNEFPCYICNQKFPQETVLAAHLKTHKGVKTYECQLCQKTFHKLTQLDRHLASTHFDSDQFKCTYCTDVYDTVNLLRRHLSTHTSKMFKCQDCQKSFDKKITLKIHKLTAHLGIKMYHCDLCNKKFRHSQTLKAHKVLHVEDKQHVCHICGYRFNQKQQLVRHYNNIHLGKKPAECKVCKKKFATNSYLTIHSRIHSGVKPYLCEYCQKPFATIAGLKVHVRIHTGLKPYACTFCERKFTQVSSFNVHIRSHTGEKPFTCTICNKNYKNNGYLKVHLRTHAEYKPYSCPKCNETFAMSWQLIRHKRNHLEENVKKRSKCNICNKNVKNLNSHMVTHSETKDFECCVCKKRFSKKFYLDKHSNIHKDKNMEPS